MCKFLIRAMTLVLAGVAIVYYSLAINQIRHDTKNQTKGGDETNGSS
jgi:hypothetical protein